MTDVLMTQTVLHHREPSPWAGGSGDERDEDDDYLRITRDGDPGTGQMERARAAHERRSRISSNKITIEVVFPSLFLLTRNPGAPSVKRICRLPLAIITTVDDE